MAIQPLSFRPITGADLNIIREWRNIPSTREMMFTCTEIDVETHQQWFNAQLNDENQHGYIVFLGQTAVAMVSYTMRLNQSGASNSPVENAAEWGFYNAPSAPPKFGFTLLSTALNFAFTHLPITRIDARVRSHNHKVLHLHHQLGFSQHPGVKIMPSDSGVDLPYYAFSLSRADFLLNTTPLPTAVNIKRSQPL